MARNPKAPDAPIATVRVTRRQLVRYAGRTLHKVDSNDAGLLVYRKRARGGRYDEHFYPWSRVIAYCEGPGGVKAPAHAVVHDHAVLLSLAGPTVVMDDGVVQIDVDTTVRDAKGEKYVEAFRHMIHPSADPEVIIDVAFEAERPDRDADARDGRPRAERAGGRKRRRGSADEQPPAEPRARRSRRDEPEDDNGQFDPDDPTDVGSDADDGSDDQEFDPTDEGDDGTADDLDILEEEPRSRGRDRRDTARGRGGREPASDKTRAARQTRSRSRDEWDD